MNHYIINDHIFNIDESEISIVYSDEYKTEILINKSLREYLQKIKTEIDNHTLKWDVYKKISKNGKSWF